MNKQTNGHNNRQTQRHGRKMLAPVLITVLLLAWLAAYGAMVLTAMPVWLAALQFVGMTAIGGAAVCMLLERINEKRSGEEDDLGKY